METMLNVSLNSQIFPSLYLWMKYEADMFLTGFMRLFFQSFLPHAHCSFSKHPSMRLSVV